MTPLEGLVTSALLAASVSAILLAILLCFPHFLVDEPNQRSLHVTPVPRTGGISIVLGAFGTAAIVDSYRVLVISAILIALVSLIDDWRKLPALPRFGAQGIIAVTFCLLTLGDLSLAEIIFLTLSLVWLANLYNFMDGSDGLAGGMTVIGFASCALGAWIGGNPALATLCATIAATSLPFLTQNFHPAKIFMGDIGAVTLGFSAAAIGAIGWRDGTWSPFFPVFVFSPFIADASLTLLRRILKKEKFWQPHREHYYQKLVRMGWGHRHTALIEYAVMLLAAMGAFSTFYFDGIAQLLAILAWGAMLMIAAQCIDMQWAKTEHGAK
ncbi:MAG: MraY family glycosyltransferase [Burkholderiales bacterium]